jgi:FtsP/CotA-like multicopper oxidase with cupredoxin domain
MRFNRLRRRVLQGVGASPLLALLPRAAASGIPRTLRLERITQSLVGVEHPKTAVWSYNGTVPGPELRIRQGDRLRVDVENQLGVDTTVHWHGIRLPNAMDGVPHLTQPPIAKNGGRFTYEFDVPDAGTFWYHPHLGNPEQVGRGLYGALVVEERSPPATDRDLVWVLSDWRLDREARNVDDFGNFMDASHAGRIGNTVTVNGAVREAFDVRAGERIRLRLINACNARIFALRFDGHAPSVIALDGHPVQSHQSSRAVLGPGMRVDLILDCTGSPGSRHRVIDDFYERQAYRLLDVVYSKEKPVRETLATIPTLPPNPTAEPRLDRATRHQVRFEGGMMGRMPAMQGGGGMMNGMSMMRGGRGGMAWTVNGRSVTDHTHHRDPMLTLEQSRTYVLDLINDTAWHHPIHLHGHAFAIISRNGKPAIRRDWSDTVLLDPRTTAEIAFVADNPGDWMFHCHVLDHQASGMMGVIKVA